jgi:hypothetical protein
MPFVIALILLVLSPAPAWPQAFEGIVNAKIGSGEGGRPPVDATYWMQSGKIRMQVTAPGQSEGSKSVVILDPAGKNTIVLLPAQKMYMMMSPPPVMGAEDRVPDVVKTGRKEKVAGFECEHWLVKDRTGDVDACVATGIGAFSTGAGRDTGWSASLSAQQGFPLKVAKVGGPTILEVTKIERQTLDPALFTVPADYTQRPGGPPRPPQPKQ